MNAGICPAHIRRSAENRSNKNGVNGGMNLKARFSWTQFILGMLAFLGILVILFLIADKIVLPLYTKQGAEVDLPDVVERSASSADSILASRGFQMIIDDSEYHPVLPESTVVFQKPPPYTKVKRGRRIYVHISAGARKVQVPRVIGVSERDAELKLRQAGLELGAVAYRVSNYPKDVVCSQGLPPNSEVQEKTEVGFTVSLGRAKTEYIAPDVIGIQYSEAVVQIRKEGLRVGKVLQRIREDLIPETVIEQDPEGGTEMNPDDSIRLIISRLPEEQG